MSPLDAWPLMRWRGEIGIGLDRPGLVNHILRCTCNILEPLKRAGSSVSATLESSTALTTSRCDSSVRSPSREVTLISHTMPGRPPPRAWSESFRMVCASGAAEAELPRQSIPSRNMERILFMVAFSNMAQGINDVLLCCAPCRHVCRHRAHHRHQHEGEQRAPDIQIDQQWHTAGAVGRDV